MAEFYKASLFGDLICINKIELGWINVAKKLHYPYSHKKSTYMGNSG